MQSGELILAFEEQVNEEIRETLARRSGQSHYRSAPKVTVTRSPGRE